MNKNPPPQAVPLLSKRRTTLHQVDKMHFLYNSKNKEFGKVMRKQETMTKAEGLLWNTALKGNKTGYRFLRQKLIGNYILDFYCAKLKLCIEVDDQSHDRKGEEDELKTKYLNNLGIKVIRYTNEQIYHNLDGVIQDLEGIVKDIENHEQISYCD